MKKGYTLIEILIVVAIVGILVSFGFSAFSKAQERQLIQDAQERIFSSLQAAQKSAYVGEKECTGALIGIIVTVAANSVSTQAQCEGGSDAAQVETFSNLTFVTTPTFTFQPLEGGVSFSAPGATSSDIDYNISGKTYRFTVVSSGIISYQGVVSP